MLSEFQKGSECNEPRYDAKDFVSWSFKQLNLQIRTNKLCRTSEPSLSAWTGVTLSPNKVLT